MEISDFNGSVITEYCEHCNMKYTEETGRKFIIKFKEHRH